MVERAKMPRKDRAKQFAPFDALKGLQDALRLKEYEHERGLKGDIQEEKIAEISKTLLEIQKNEMVKLTYFFDGYYKEITGKAKVDILNQEIKVDNIKVNFNDIFDIVRLAEK